MVRRSDPGPAQRAFAAQARLTAGWLAGRDLAGPSALPGWSQAELAAHLCRSGERLLELAGERTAQPPLSVADYVAGYAGAAEEIRERSRGDSPGDLRAVADAVEALVVAPHTVPAPRGPLRLADLAATRVLEVVVHSLDLSREVPLHRDALGLSVRLLAEVAAERHPGRSVELRIAPFAAVQLLAGATHRRGTPPAVVEVEPVPWLLLATGRLSWAEAGVRASGERSDLSALLPLLR